MPIEAGAAIAQTAEETLIDQAAFDRASDRLIAVDPRLALLVEVAGRPVLRRRAAGFSGLAAMIVAQQVSAASARAIFARLETALEGTITPHAVLAAGPEGLRAAGLSTPKIRYLLDIAGRIEAGIIDLDAIAALPSDTAREHLVALPGIGAWTADVYLLFALGRADAFPEGDLALQVAASEALGLERRCHALGLKAIAEDWRPWRGVAAQLLWAFYSARRANMPAEMMPGTPIAPDAPMVTP
ncbi:DNA-3-methyladenine glycosylase [Bosea sp. 117]|uniref:DNA-3-methyladenine glycosylase family protein n=1 Tax=Bosea sp. 117 TaxID=1125973 RepID=UPI0009DF1DC7|nr:DNA-3-methyladenine glycosylase [Bosea sp. 117]